MLHRINIPLILFLGYLLYNCIGFFPIAPIEEDSNGIANGIQYADVAGKYQNIIAYRYAVQPGTYILVGYTRYLFGGDSLEVFAILCAIASIGSIFILMFWAGKLLGISPYICGIILLLFPESMAEGYYCNSNILAAIFVFFGFYILTKYPTFWAFLAASVLFSLGGWMRIDLLLILPACLILIRRNYSWKRTLLYTSLISLAVLLITVLLLYLSGSNIPMIVTIAGDHLNDNYNNVDLPGLNFNGGYAIKNHLPVFPK
jgi:hypothetical protein